MSHPHLFTDTSGKKSVTMSAFIWGFLVVNAKLLLSGVKIWDITMSTFGGSEYALGLSALGAIYVLRRSTDPSRKEGDRKDGTGT